MGISSRMILWFVLSGLGSKASLGEILASRKLTDTSLMVSSSKFFFLPLSDPDVIAQEGDSRRVVILLNVITTGFEGDDSRTMAISGLLPDGV